MHAIITSVPGVTPSTPRPASGRPSTSSSSAGLAALRHGVGVPLFV